MFVALIVTKCFCKRPIPQTPTGLHDYMDNMIVTNVFVKIQINCLDCDLYDSDISLETPE